MRCEKILGVVGVGKGEIIVVVVTVYDHVVGHRWSWREGQQRGRN